MSLDECSPAVEHARLVEHYERQPSSRNWVDEADRAKEVLAEEIAITRDRLAVLEAQYARVDAFEPPHHDTEPGDRGRAGLDLKLWDIDGDETRGQWREPESIPSRVIDVAVGSERV